MEWQQKGCYKYPRNKVFKRLFFKKTKIGSLLKKRDFEEIFDLCKTAAAEEDGLDVGVIGISVIT